MRERFQLDPAVRLRYESRIDGGTGFVFHNRRQSLRQCRRPEIEVLRALARTSQSVAELSAELGLSPDSLAPFLLQLEQEEIVCRVESNPVPGPGSGEPG